MINSIEPLSMAEVKKIIEKDEEKKELVDFIKRFIKLDEKQAKELKAELMALDIMKLKPQHIVKIVDFLPEDASDVYKICIDAGLTEDEVKKILDVVAKYR